MSLEKCVWKELEENPDSTTFIDVRTAGTEHPLYKCTICTGYKTIRDCEYFRVLKYNGGYK